MLQMKTLSRQKYEIAAGIREFLNRENTHTDNREEAESRKEASDAKNNHAAATR